MSVDVAEGVFLDVFGQTTETKDAGAQHHGCAVSSCEELRMLLGRLGFEIY